MARLYDSHYDDLVPKIDLGSTIHDISMKIAVVNEDWEERVSALQLLPPMMVEFEKLRFGKALEHLKDGFVVQLKDLRSSVIKEVCLVFEQLSEYLTDAFHNLADTLLPSLLKLVGNAKVMSGYANHCIETFIEHSSSSRSFLLFFENLKNRNTAIKSHAFSYIFSFFHRHRESAGGSFIERSKDKWIQVLQLGLNDTSETVRVLSCSFYWVLHPLFTKQVERVLEKLTARRKKAVHVAQPNDLPKTNVPSKKDTKRRVDHPSTALGGKPKTSALPPRSVRPRISMHSKPEIVVQKRVNSKIQGVKRTEQKENQRQMEGRRETLQPSSSTPSSSFLDSIPEPQRRESFHYHRLNRRAEERSTTTTKHPGQERSRFSFSSAAAQRKKQVSNADAPSQGRIPSLSSSFFKKNLKRTAPSENKTTALLSESNLDTILDFPTLSLPTTEEIELPAPRPILPEFSMALPLPDQRTSRKRLSASPYSPPMSPVSLKRDEQFSMFSPNSGPSHQEPLPLPFEDETVLDTIAPLPSVDRNDMFMKLCDELDTASDSVSAMDCLDGIVSFWDDYCLSEISEEEDWLLHPLISITKLLSNNHFAPVHQDCIRCLSRALIYFSKCMERWLTSKTSEQEFPLGFVGSFLPLIKPPTVFTTSGLALSISTVQLCKTFSECLPQLFVEQLMFTIQTVLEQTSLDITYTMNILEGGIITVANLMECTKKGTFQFIEKEFKILLFAVSHLRDSSRLSKAIKIIYQYAPHIFCSTIRAYQISGVSEFGEFFSQEKCDVLRVVYENANPNATKAIRTLFSIQKYTKLEEGDANSSLCFLFFTEIDSSLWESFISYFGDLLYQCILPILSSQMNEDARTNRLKQFYVDELKLKALELYERLRDSNVYSADCAIPLLMKLYAQTNHAIIRKDCERQLAILCRSVASSDLTDIFISFLTSQDIRDEQMADYFNILNAITKENPESSSWLDSICAHPTVTKSLQNAPVLTRFSIFSCITTLSALPHSEIHSSLSNHYKSLLDFRLDE